MTPPVGSTSRLPLVISVLLAAYYSITAVKRSMPRCGAFNINGIRKPRAHIRTRRLWMKRRDFLKASGSFTVVAVIGYDKASGQGTPLSKHPISQGYLLVDTSKCQGCLACMLACSLAHEGKESLSLSRIQVIQHSFERFPRDITIAQCRQCVEPECLEQCPTGALYVDTANGNVRTINEEECEGCMACVLSCPHLPSRAIWDYQRARPLKCDLCADTPYSDKVGGPGGQQVCMAVCPMNAIVFTSEVPLQQGDEGYNVNLRGETWKRLGYPID
jgi:protein NrfC